MGLLDYTLQHQGSPWGLHEPGLLHRPPPPSPNSFQRPLARGKSTPSHPAPGESIKPVLLPADPPRESRSAAGAGAARLPGRCQPRPRGICHQAKALRRGSEALAESGFSHFSHSELAAASWQGLRQGAPLESEENTAGEEDSRAAERGEEEEGLLLFAVASFVLKFLPQGAACLWRQLWPASTPISCSIFLRVSPPPARQSDLGRGDATLLGKSHSPSEAVSRRASLESSLCEAAPKEAVLYFHLYPKA